MRFERYGLGIAKGLRVTLKHLPRKPITTQYPEQRLTVSRRFRGNHLVWDPVRCTGCATCAKSCPQGAIQIVTSRGDDNRYVVERFRVDTGHCIFCGLCVESCPYEALFMGQSYEEASYRLPELVDEKEECMAKLPSAYFRPALEPGLPRQTLLIERPRRGL